MRTYLLALFLTTTMGCSTDKGTDTKTAPASAKPPMTAHEEADNKATEDEQARRAALADKADVKAADDAELAKTRKVTHDQLQARFDAADRRFNELQATAGKVTGTKKRNAAAVVGEIKTREATVMASIAKLRGATGAAWDATKQQVDIDAAALDQAIDTLATTLQ